MITSPQHNGMVNALRQRCREGAEGWMEEPAQVRSTLALAGIPVDTMAMAIAIVPGSPGFAEVKRRSTHVKKVGAKDPAQIVGAAARIAADLVATHGVRADVARDAVNVWLGAVNLPDQMLREPVGPLLAMPGGWHPWRRLLVRTAYAGWYAGLALALAGLGWWGWAAFHDHRVEQAIGIISAPTGDLRDRLMDPLVQAMKDDPRVVSTRETVAGRLAEALVGAATDDLARQLPLSESWAIALRRARQTLEDPLLTPNWASRLRTAISIEQQRRYEAVLAFLSEQRPPDRAPAVAWARLAGAVAEQIQAHQDLLDAIHLTTLQQRETAAYAQQSTARIAEIEALAPASLPAAPAAWRPLEDAARAAQSEPGLTDHARARIAALADQARHHRGEALLAALATQIPTGSGASPWSTYLESLRQSRASESLSAAHTESLAQLITAAEDGRSRQVADDAIQTDPGLLADLGPGIEFLGRLQRVARAADLRRDDVARVTSLLSQRAIAFEQRIRLQLAEGIPGDLLHDRDTWSRQLALAQAYLAIGEPQDTRTATYAIRIQQFEQRHLGRQVRQARLTSITLQEDSAWENSGLFGTSDTPLEVIVASAGTVLATASVSGRPNRAPPDPTPLSFEVDWFQPLHLTVRNGKDPAVAVIFPIRANLPATLVKSAAVGAPAGLTFTLSTVQGSPDLPPTW